MMAAQESMWLIQLMKDLHQLVNYGVLLYCDNQSAVCLAKNPLFHARTKHVEVHYHYIREKVIQGEIEMKAIRTNDQVADIFIKGFGAIKFAEFWKQLGMTTQLELQRRINVEGEC